MFVAVVFPTDSEVNNKLWAMPLAYKRILRTIFTDNGSEFAGHPKKLSVPIFFYCPYSIWQNGTVDHASKLIRQYIPPNANFDNITQEELQKY